MSFLRTLRTSCIVFVLGAGLGGKVVYDYMNQQLAHVMNLALKGNCTQPDADQKPFWFPCADFFIMAKIQQEAVDEDQKNALGDAQSAAVLAHLRQQATKKRVIH